MSLASELESHLAEQVRLVTEIVPMMSGIAITRVSTAIRPGEELAFGSVFFHGGWEGAMKLECAVPLALQFASRFMSIPLPEGMDENVVDSLGELANTIAGNFKPLLPAGTTISLPTVTLTKESDPLLQAYFVRSEVDFETEFGRLCTKLYAAPRKMNRASA